MRRRGRPSLRLEYCVKRDVRKAGEEEDWKKTMARGGWKSCGHTSITPDKGKKRKREEKSLSKNNYCNQFGYNIRPTTAVNDAIQLPVIAFSAITRFVIICNDDARETK